MAKKSVVLGLGSNLGDRLGHLQKAIDELSEFIQIQKISSVYETPPFDMEADTNFYNLCLLGATHLNVFDLLSNCQDIEKEHGRKAKVNPDRYESRPLDIDILYFNDEIIDTDDLKIPHPELHKRRFVLVPLNEILPEHFDPLRKRTVRELVTKSEDNSTIHQIVKQIRINK